MRPALLLAGCMLMAACATSKEAQVRGALQRAGVPEEMSACMATPLARDLSTAQLRNLGKVAKTARTNAMTLTPQQVLETLQRDIEPDTVAVVMRAGLGCLFRG